MKTLLKVLQYLLWTLAFLALVAIGVCNTLPDSGSLPGWVSPALSYGLLYCIDLGLLAWVLRTKDENTSDASFFLKLGGVILFFVWTTVTVLDKIIRG